MLRLLTITSNIALLMQSTHLEKDSNDSRLHVFPMRVAPLHVNLLQLDRSNVLRLDNFLIAFIVRVLNRFTHTCLDASVLLNCLTGQELAGPPDQKICQNCLIASTCQTFTWPLVAFIGTNSCLISQGIWIELKSSIGCLAFHNCFECWNVQFALNPTKLDLINIACLMASGAYPAQILFLRQVAQQTEPTLYV